MDVKEFVKQRNRMCKKYSTGPKPCGACPAAVYSCISMDEIEEENFELIDIVEKWAKENPNAAVKETPDGELKTTLQRYVNTLKKDHWRYREKITEAAAAKDGETERFYYGICTQIMMTVCELERWLEG